jgi:hypothetical protein
MSKMAPSKNLDLRFAVGTIIGPRSSIWRITSQRNDVYVSSGGSRTSKISFHESKICRTAFHEAHEPVTVTNRLMHKWRRADTPPAESGRACLLMRLGIATDFLSTSLEVPRKKVTWVPAAQTNKTRVICVLLTNDIEERLRADLGKECDVLAYKRLPNGEAVAVMTYVAESNEKDFAIPSSHHQKRHIIISKNDPANTGRPVRFFAENDPKDGDCQEISELGGYYHDGLVPTGVGLFKRATVIATQDTPVKIKF